MLGSANKLKTARKISMSGAVSGSGSFDGSGNVNIVTTQANIAKITGSTLFSNLFKYANFSVDYPNGFNEDNCVPIAFGYTRPYNLHDKPSYAFGGYINNNMMVALNTATKKLEVAIYDPSELEGEEDVTINYVIVLMKIS